MSENWHLYEEIAGVVGTEKADAIIEARGGGRVCIPSKMREGHWLAKLIGHDFTAGRGSLNLELPLGKSGFKARIRRNYTVLVAEGKSSDTIARTLGISRRTVLRWNAKLKAEQRGD